MADKKISALTAAATPLDGTEVLPIVQSGATVKVANNDLRPKQIQSNATSGVLQVVGPAAAATRVATVPDANFTVARTDAAQSFTGDQTLSTGNLIIGTSGKGIDFSATSGTGTSELLADYEEGTWTGTLKGGTTDPTTPVTATGTYTKIGRSVTVSINFSNVDTTGANGAVFVTGLPFAASASFLGTVGTFSLNLNGGTSAFCYTSGGNLEFLTSTTNAAWNDLLHTGAASRFLWTTCTYFV
jgi:hypothetical protein